MPSAWKVRIFWWARLREESHPLIGRGCLCCLHRFHERLHTLCQQRGLTVSEVAMQARLTAQECRALQEPLLLYDPKLTTIIALARVFQVPPKALFD